MWERQALSVFFQPFRAEPHKFYIYVNTLILYLSCYIICQKKMLFDLIIKKKITETPFGAPTVVPVRGVS